MIDKLPAQPMARVPLAAKLTAAMERATSSSRYEPFVLAEGIPVIRVPTGVDRAQLLDAINGFARADGADVRVALSVPGIGRDATIKVIELGGSTRAAIDQAANLAMGYAATCFNGNSEVVAVGESGTRERMTRPARALLAQVQEVLASPARADLLAEAKAMPMRATFVTDLGDGRFEVPIGSDDDRLRLPTLRGTPAEVLDALHVLAKTSRASFVNHQRDAAINDTMALVEAWGQVATAKQVMGFVPVTDAKFGVSEATTVARGLIERALPTIAGDPAMRPALLAALKRLRGDVTYDEHNATRESFNIVLLGQLHDAKVFLSADEVQAMLPIRQVFGIASASKPKPADPDAVRGQLTRMAAFAVVCQKHLDGPGAAAA